MEWIAHVNLPFDPARLHTTALGARRIRRNLNLATERKVLKNIMTDTYPRTCIVTTHRPTVLGICTRVYAIRGKKCEELGEKEILEMEKDF